MKPNTITLEVIDSSLAYASEEMGLALRNAAYSPNIKERMDHSAAVFDAKGRLRSQAEHIPVHLGSLPWGMKNLIRWCAKEGMDFEEGSMVVSNNPYICGTHLNDVTLVNPIFESGRLVAFAANKAHHSDVGGKVPGSISIDSSDLFEEGLVIEPMRLTRRGKFLAGPFESISNASRTPHERIGDLKAQVAANLIGQKRIKAVISKYGIGAFEESSKYSFFRSESIVRRRLNTFRAGIFRALDFLEGPGGSDLILKAEVTIDKGTVSVDYSGTSSQVEYSLNSVFGVTLSGVYFVIRCLTGGDVPTNHGAFAPIKVRAPSGTLVNPTFPHPVGGGNVETSQRNADLIFRALSKAARRRVPAAAGGSMNNIMIGGGRLSRRWAFYETIGVGLGGQIGRDGTDGIQCNMTNTMNTPIEEIERSMPLLITKYEFRRDSAGQGEFRGGCGLTRGYRSLTDEVVFTVLADRSRHRPWGLYGGGRGKPTEVLLRTPSGETRIPSKSTHVLSKGDEVEIRTAGGGGYGRAANRLRDSIKEDLESGLLSAESAGKEYGVEGSL